MKDKLNFFSILISCVVASITIIIAIFAWVYVLQILAKSELYGVGDVDAINFFVSSNFASIGYESIIAIVGLITSKPIIISIFVIIGFLFFIQLVAIFGAYLDKRVEGKIPKNENNSSKLNKILMWIWRNFKVSIILGFSLWVMLYIIAIVFLSNAYLVPVMQKSIVNKGSNSRYCNILISKDGESQVLRVNLDNNYKLSWTYYGLLKTTVNDLDPYYPNKLNDVTRANLRNKFCK